jgi:hypothetical protein
MYCDIQCTCILVPVENFVTIMSLNVSLFCSDLLNSFDIDFTFGNVQLMFKLSPFEQASGKQDISKALTISFHERHFADTMIDLTISFDNISCHWIKLYAIFFHTNFYAFLD